MVLCSICTKIVMSFWFIVKAFLNMEPHGKSQRSSLRLTLNVKLGDKVLVDTESSDTTKDGLTSTDPAVELGEADQPSPKRKKNTPKKPF